MHSNVHPEDVALFRRAVICKAFPAYTLESARRAGREVLWAMDMLAIDSQV